MARAANALANGHTTVAILTAARAHVHSTRLGPAKLMLITPRTTTPSALTRARVIDLPGSAHASLGSKAQPVIDRHAARLAAEGTVDA